GEVDVKARARERYEEAILSGHSAAILEQERSSLFTQDVGNIPPGQAVTSEIVVDQKLRWLLEGRWEWRFPTVVAPRYMGARPGGTVVDVAANDTGVRCSLEMVVADRLPAGARPESTSHPMQVVGGTQTDLRFHAEDGVRLDRDVVVSWPVAGDRAECQLAVSRLGGDDPAGDGTYGLLTIVPPQGSTDSVARDLILLLDTSGSMGGEPLDQARRVALALVDSLTERDTLQMLDFNWRVRRWKRSAKKASDRRKAEARRWLHALTAGGGTEMHSGILEALAPLRPGAQRQVIVMTDGLIGFEHDVIDAIVNRLPQGSRVHMVGVGSAVNRSLTMPCARAGRGVEAIIAIGEDPERFARRLVAHTAAPLLVDLEISGTAVVESAPAHLPDLHAGAPALVSLRLREGEIVVRGALPEGRFEQRLQVDAVPHAHGSRALAALFARERVEDLELARSTGRSVDEAITDLGLRYQISTRLTSWVAVSEEATVDPTAPTRRETMPHELPHGISAEGLGLRAVTAQSVAGPAVLGMAQASQGFAGGFPPPPAAVARPSVPTSASRRSTSLSAPAGPPPGAPPPAAAPLQAKPEVQADQPVLAEKQKRRLAPSSSVSRAEDEGFGGAMDDFDDEALEEGAFEEPELEALAPRKRGGVFRRLVDGVRDLFTGEGREEPTPLLQGKVVLRKDGMLTIEVTAASDVDWRVEQVLAFADGNWSEVAVVTDRTTREGSVPAGRTLRLTVRWSEAASLPTTLTVDLARTQLVIAL
ncbi:MAG: VWA domain-containing protein, partial [Myxococcales bacterium]|nr:VWA domain-containing protein [Myxococcales bacterium]